MIAQALHDKAMAVVESAKAEGQYVSIDDVLPSVFVYIGPDQEYFYQEHQADKIIEDHKQLAEEWDLTLEDAILYCAQEW